MNNSFRTIYLYIYILFYIIYLTLFASGIQIRHYLLMELGFQVGLSLGGAPDKIVFFGCRTNSLYSVCPMSNQWDQLLAMLTWFTLNIDPREGIDSLGVALAHLVSNPKLSAHSKTNGPSEQIRWCNICICNRRVGEVMQPRDTQHNSQKTDYSNGGIQWCNMMLHKITNKRNPVQRLVQFINFQWGNV